MRRLLNTLFILSEDLYLSLENENLAAWREHQLIQRMPLINLENILCFSYRGASPALMGACAQRNIGFCFLTPQGKFLARTLGMSRGNVLLRKEQYHQSDQEEQSLRIAKYFIVGKLYNSRTVLMRAARDHPLSVDTDAFSEGAADLLDMARRAENSIDLDELRGIEGNGAQIYFSLFDQMILSNKAAFSFQGRNKRPPLDRVNAILSFLYTVLAHDCASALESTGLDAYAGFLHRDRPGRISLALDLMEELRAPMVDRMVLTLINNRVVTPAYFQVKENGTVWLNDKGRQVVLGKWQERKKDGIQHPFLQEKIPWGLLPYVQALLLARYIRGDLDAYPAFLWR